MARTEIQLDRLLNRRVYAANGVCIGRLEEVCAVATDGEWTVTEYLVGAYALLERLSAWHIGRAVLDVLGTRRKGGGYRVPWDRLDVSDPDRPRLLCKVSELSPIEEGR